MGVVPGTRGWIGGGRWAKSGSAGFARAYPTTKLLNPGINFLFINNQRGGTFLGALNGVVLTKLMSKRGTHGIDTRAYCQSKQSTKSPVLKCICTFTLFD